MFLKVVLVVQDTIRINHK